MAGCTGRVLVRTYLQCGCRSSQSWPFKYVAFSSSFFAFAISSRRSSCHRPLSSSCHSSFELAGTNRSAAALHASVVTPLSQVKLIVDLLTAHHSVPFASTSPLSSLAAALLRFNFLPCKEAQISSTGSSKNGVLIHTSVAQPREKKSAFLILEHGVLWLEKSLFLLPCHCWLFW